MANKNSENPSLGETPLAGGGAIIIGSGGWGCNDYTTKDLYRMFLEKNAIEVQKKLDEAYVIEFKSKSLNESPDTYPEFSIDICIKDEKITTPRHMLNMNCYKSMNFNFASVSKGKFTTKINVCDSLENLEVVLVDGYFEQRVYGNAFVLTCSVKKVLVGWIF